MPIQAYKCKDCGKEFDSFFKTRQEFEKKRIVTCPFCSSKNVYKLLSTFGFNQSFFTLH